MPSFIEQITAARLADALSRADILPSLRQSADATEPPRDFFAALIAPGLSLIAEVKRASPSAGGIAPGADPVVQATAYEAGGAAAISVLTEPNHFGGSLDDLRAVHAAVSIPVLRKDFLCHPLHVVEARAAGADAVLLIVAALSDDVLGELHELATSLGMTALVEVHDADEVPRALAIGARVIGINTRDLRTLTVTPGVVAAVRPFIPAGVIVVGESGIRTRADVAMMEASGCDAVLVGEALMRAGDPQAAVGTLLGRSA